MFNTVDHKKIRKRHFFVIGECIEDVKQDEKHVPDLLEPIMRPTFFVKEELRPILFKSNQFESKIHKNRGFNCLDSGIRTDSRRRPMPAFSLVSSQQYLAALAAKYSKKCRL